MSPLCLFFILFVVWSNDRLDALTPLAALFAMCLCPKAARPVLLSVGWLSVRPLPAALLPLLLDWSFAVAATDRTSS